MRPKQLERFDRSVPGAAGPDHQHAAWPGTTRRPDRLGLYRRRDRPALNTRKAYDRNAVCHRAAIAQDIYGLFDEGPCESWVQTVPSVVHGRAPTIPMHSTARQQTTSRYERWLFHIGRALRRASLAIDRRRSGAVAPTRLYPTPASAQLKPVTAP